MSESLRRAKKRNFFIAQNIIFDLDISEHAKITYLYISRCADNDNETAFPSYNKIGKKCSFSRSTALRAVKELLEIGLLEVENRVIEKNGKILNTSNLYTVYEAPSDEYMISKGLISAPSVSVTPPLVSEGNHPSVSVTPPLVSEGNHPSVSVTPNKYPTENTYFINTQSIYQEDGIEGLNNITPFNSKKKKSPSTTATEEKATVLNETYNSITHSITNPYELHNRVMNDLNEHTGIPYSYKADEQLMTEAVHILTGWGHIYDWEQYSQEKGFDCEVFKLINQCLIDMMCSNEPMKLNNSNVTYKHVIDAVNESTQFIGRVPEITDFIAEVKSDYGQASKDREIKNPKAYMKSCIWTSLNNHKLKFANKSYQMLKSIGAVE